MNCIDMNAWYSRVDKPERPDYVVFDLDPPESRNGFTQAIRVAHLIREALEQLGLESYPKTSGADGIHVLVPITRRSSYRDAYDFAELVSRGLEAENPGLVTTEWLKKKRRGVLVDHRQNGHGKTIASAYSVRPKPGAPVSTPLQWAELGEKVRPRDFGRREALERVERHGDLFEPVLRGGQALGPALRRLAREQLGVPSERRRRLGARARPERSARGSQIRDVRSTGGRGSKTGAAAVRAGDELDDREAEPGSAAAARLVGAAEAVERALSELGRETPAGVADVQLHERSPRLGPGQLDRPLAVRERIVDEVHDRLADAKRIGLDLQLGLHDSQLSTEGGRSAREPRRGVVQQVCDRDDLRPDRQLALVGAGDQQETVGESGQALRLVGRRAKGALELLARAGAAEREVELRAEQRQRSPKPPARSATSGAVLDGRRQPVETSRPASARAGHLTPAAGTGSLLGSPGRTASARLPQELHPSQGPGRERVTAERRGEQGEGKEDEGAAAQMVE